MFCVYLTTYYGKLLPKYSTGRGRGSLWFLKKSGNVFI